MPPGLTEEMSMTVRSWFGTVSLNLVSELKKINNGNNYKCFVVGVILYTPVGNSNITDIMVQIRGTRRVCNIKEGKNTRRTRRVCNIQESKNSRRTRRTVVWAVYPRLRKNVGLVFNFQRSELNAL